jgi:hypothetical protein
MKAHGLRVIDVGELRNAAGPGPRTVFKPRRSLVRCPTDTRHAVDEFAQKQWMGGPSGRHIDSAQASGATALNVFVVTALLRSSAPHYGPRRPHCACRRSMIFPKRLRKAVLLPTDRALVNFVPPSSAARHCRGLWPPWRAPMHPALYRPQPGTLEQAFFNLIQRVVDGDAPADRQTLQGAPRLPTFRSNSRLSSSW